MPRMLVVLARSSAAPPAPGLAFRFEEFGDRETLIYFITSALFTQSEVDSAKSSQRKPWSIGNQLQELSFLTATLTASCTDDSR
jgi:hypothetical protein